MRRWWRKLLLRRRYQKAQALLRQLEKSMALLKYSRGARRSFWRDFVRSGKFRQDVLEEAVKDLDND